MLREKRDAKPASSRTTTVKEHDNQTARHSLCVEVTFTDHQPHCMWPSEPHQQRQSGWILWWEWPQNTTRNQCFVN